MIEIKEIQIDAKDLNKNNITAPLNESNIWKGFDNQADMQYIKECAESVGMDVTDRTAFTIPFIAEVMRRMNQSNRSKEVYNKGYKDGQEAIAFHYELCKEEGSIITVPEGATNGDVIKAIFPNDLWLRIHARRAKKDWWNSSYRKEQE